MPRSREFCGTLDAVATASKVLSVMEASGKRLTAVWTKDTLFIDDGKVADASTLNPAQRVCVFYRTPWIGRVYVTKVVW